MKRKQVKKSRCVAIITILLLLSLTTVSAYAQKQIYGLAAFAPGTASNAISVAVVNVINKYTDVKVTPEPVSGALRYGPLLEKGEMHLAFPTIISQKEFYENEGLTAGKSAMRTLGLGHSNRNGFICRGDRGIRSMEDLAGKKIFIDFPGVISNNLIGLGLLRHYGIADKVTNLKISSPPAMFSALIEGKADCAFFSVTPDATEIKRTCGLAIPPIPPQVIKAVFAEKEPSVLSGTYPKGYLGVVDVETPVTLANTIVVVHKDVPADDVYKMKKAIHDHRDELRKTYVVAAEWARTEIPWETISPFHPGAIRFYKEVGTWTAQAETLQQRLLKAK